MAILNSTHATFEKSNQVSQLFVQSLHQKYHTRLRRFLANRLGNESDAEDLTQEVYLRFSRLSNFERIQSTRAFLFTTALNLLRDHTRRLSTQLSKASLSIDQLELECSVSDPAEKALYAEDLELLECALQQVSPNCRQAFFESRAEGKTYPEIATSMNISVSMVEKHISAALRALRTAISD